MQIERLHWAGIKLQQGQTTLLLDTIPSPQQLPLSVDTPHRFALLTHHHPDHADLPYLTGVLGSGSTLLTHADVAPLLPPTDLRIRTAELHQPVQLHPGTADFTVWAVPAVDGLGDPQVSWVIDGGGKRILHAGDTLWHGRWWSIQRIYGPFDTVFLPINAPRVNLGRFQDSGIPIVMGPEQAVAAARILQAKTVVPIHYGRHEPGRYIETPDALQTFTRLGREAGLNLNVLQPGEVLNFQSAQPEEVLQ
ncbi:MBL fold metallo-hydrolase [Deinococcus roseus]|uniref:Metallo-beta-lactamase domain-containing protein n=1 Tax=Deinococcus roseus TaxID=392414 RepID=A0ABQ2DJ66_9DEIO|nr:MBL fold metallo-hydrolase [Deinococcus roseus]GGJ57122.1 hypothetical protein GCM10008938_49020 [Deinococcus roseus]